MGNCCAAPKSARPNLERPPLKRTEEKAAAAEPEEDLETAAESKRKRQARLDDLGLFRSRSFLERKHGKSLDTDPSLNKRVKTDFTEASAALLRTYQPLEVNLGEGAFGEVFLFQSRADSRLRYAVKVLFREDMDPAIFAAVNQEVEILAKLDHPHIVRYTESFEDEHNLYIVMEQVRDATDLQGVIDKRKAAVLNDATRRHETLFREEEVRRTMRMLLEALHHIHTNGVVHRDLKPENCLVDRAGRLRIIDFGLSKMSNHQDEGQLLLGTPYYLAPEVHEL